MRPLVCRFFPQEFLFRLPSETIGVCLTPFSEAVLMSTPAPRRHTRSRPPDTVSKPRGTFHPRVQAVGPEHFGLVTVDCAKARSKWMLADFFGNILVPPGNVAHNRTALAEAVAQLRLA